MSSGVEKIFLKWHKMKNNFLDFVAYFHLPLEMPIVYSIQFNLILKQAMWEEGFDHVMHKGDKGFINF